MELNAPHTWRFPKALVSVHNLLAKFVPVRETTYWKRGKASFYLSF